MAHSIRPSFGDDTHRRFVSLTHSAGLPEVRRLSSASVGKGQGVLMFTLQVMVGAAAAAATILALFAWTRTLQVIVGTGIF
jgi:hypothetical protein